METRDYKAILSDIESRIGNARLMAVSKTRTIDEIMAVYDAGCRLFGENHASWIPTYSNEYGIMSWLLNQTLD